MEKITETERQIERDKETELQCLIYLDYSDTFKRTYPKTKDIYDRRITSFLLPYGIKIIDSWFSKQIQSESKYSKEELKNMIRRNPHLHNVIKTDLLSNLKRKK